MSTSFFVRKWISSCQKNERPVCWKKDSILSHFTFRYYSATALDKQHSFILIIRAKMPKHGTVSSPTPKYQAGAYGEDKSRKGYGHCIETEAWIIHWKMTNIDVHKIKYATRKKGKCRLLKVTSPRRATALTECIQILIKFSL